jgi:DNA repair protein RadC
VDLLTLGFSRREEDVDRNAGLGRKLLERFGSIRGLGEASFEAINSETGFEGFEYLRAQALLELGRRIGEAGKGESVQLDSAEDAYRRLRYLRTEKKEHFVAVLLDAQNAIQREATIHIGTLTMSVVGPREVFREAIRDGACSIIVAHNHPSGDHTPSPEDIQVTKTLVKVGDMLDIPVLDHIIIGERGYTSLKEAGLM